ncbi:hypothetical protein K445DRAFT_243050 [Daldinia sp. EC12]|nr:hypothetical protein K445DRAFT_243050 [Daldinia sp. EC12]
MGLSTTTRDSMSTRRTVFETSSKSASEGTIGPMHEDDSLLRLDGEQICYGPWDDWNLFERLTNSDIDREYAMEEYVNYLSNLFKKLPGVYTPPSYPTGLPLSTYEDAYETDGRASPCPSLTDNSTLSRSSSSLLSYTRRVVAPIEVKTTTDT